MFGNLFKIKPGKFLGIDVGTSYIKVVELSRQGNKISLENYGELGIQASKDRPFRTFEKDNLLLSEQDIAEVVKAIYKEAKIQTKEVNFSIPDFSSFFTTFKIPQMTLQEIPEALKYEVRPYIPLPLSEITLDWLITEGEAGKTPLKVLVVAIPNDIVNQYAEIAKLAKLELKSLEPEVFSLARALKASLQAPNQKEVVALMDFGARSTTCSILDKGVFKISHSFNIGSNELTGTLARSLNIEYNEAEEMKKNQGISGQTNVKNILTPLVDEIITESQTIFSDYSRTEGREVEKIILAGGLALLPGLKDYFNSQTTKEVEIANPFANILYPQDLAETLKNSGPSFSIAVGLALKGFE